MTNEIKVSLLDLKTETIRHEIEQALERRAVRDATNLQIEIRDNVVKLTGTVYSWAEREAVLGAARYTPGVLSVEDHLRLEAGS